ncbi:MAG: FAD-dependent thymidylate synthase [Candidatus Eisenbacteria bacterium]|nr:FAD-dependent thymidylate synthase [Candidatus Eisenbacteria bacterium]
MPETGHPLRVYTLDGLPAEVVAVAFAKTSRVPDPFDAIARELTEADSSRFHEKWVVGYGHSSVAEHAVLSIAVENLSVLAAKVLEENRLSSFTEKSTRYQVMDGSNYHTPPAFSDGRPAAAYRGAVTALFAAYADAVREARAWCEREAAERPTEGAPSPSARACDMVRCLLPAAAKTNVGWTVNARSLGHAVVKMASHELSEVREIARELKRVAGAKLPTLLRHTEASPYLAAWEERVNAAAPGRSPVRGGRGAESGADGVRLVRHDPDGEERVLAALLFRATGRSYADARAAVADMNEKARRALLDASLRGIGGHEAPVREFESAGYTFEIVVDFGAYRDIQRHRMTSQTRQLLGVELGYAIPDDARAAGVAGRVERALDEARERCRELAAIDPVHAQYAVPLAFNQRFLISMNFREAYQFVRLRSRSGGHESYRRVARAVKREIERAHPLLGALIPAGDAGAPDGRAQCAAAQAEGGPRPART